VVGNGLFVLNGGIAAHGDSVIEGKANVIGSVQLDAAPASDGVDDTSEATTPVVLRVNGEAAFGSHVAFASNVTINQSLVVSETAQFGKGLVSRGRATLLGGLFIQSPCSTQATSASSTSDAANSQCSPASVVLNAGGSEDTVAMAMKWQAATTVDGLQGDEHRVHLGWSVPDGAAAGTSSIGPSFGLFRTQGNNGGQGNGQGKSESSLAEARDVPQILISPHGSMSLESGDLQSGEGVALSLTGDQGVSLQTRQGNISLFTNETNGASIVIGRPPQCDTETEMSVDVWLNHAVLRTPSQQRLIAQGQSGVEITAEHGDASIEASNGSISLTSLNPIRLRAPRVLISGGQIVTNPNERYGLDSCCFERLFLMYERREIIYAGIASVCVSVCVSTARLQ
jgi:hypothetical protein